MSHYDIIRVGLPITLDTITDEFLSIVDKLASDPSWIGVMTSDYDITIPRNDQQNAPAGYKVLIDAGFKFSTGTTLEHKTIITYGRFWKNRNPIEVANGLLRSLKDLHAEHRFSTVVTFTPGSPYIDDSISRILLSVYDDIHVVDTKGAPTIVSDYIGGKYNIECDVRNYDDFYKKTNTTIDKSKALILSCLQAGYYPISLHDILTEVQPTRVVPVSVGLEIASYEYTLQEALDNAFELYHSDATYTFAFIFD